MKKMILIFSTIVLLIESLCLAKWEKFEYKNKFNNLFRLVVGGPKSIWALARIKDKAGKLTIDLFKWNEIEKQFKPCNVFFSDEYQLYPFKNGIFIGFPKEYDYKTKIFAQNVTKKLFSFAKQEFKKLVLEKKIPQRVEDKFLKESQQKTQISLLSIANKSFIGQVYPEAKEKKVMNYIFEISEAVDNLNRKLIKNFIPSFITPLKLLMNNKIKVIKNFKNFKILGGGALGADDFWILVKDIKKGASNLNCSLQHMKNKKWKKVGEDKIIIKQFRVGKDRSIFINSWYNGLLKWNGSSWIKSSIDFKELKIEDFSVVSASDIWFSSKDSSNKNINFFHWDGKKLKQKGSFKNFQTNIVAAPGVVFIINYKDEIYRWVEEA